MIPIELTEEQRKELQADHGKPVEVVDPATHQQYVLVAREQFDRVRYLLEQPSVPSAGPSPKIAPMMLRSMQAHWRALTELLKAPARKQRWVAYHGDERIGFGATRTELYQQCFQRGLQSGEFYVGKLERDPEGLPPWVTYAGDRSLYEFAAGEYAPAPPNAE